MCVVDEESLEVPMCTMEKNVWKLPYSMECLFGRKLGFAASSEEVNARKLWQQPGTTTAATKFWLWAFEALFVEQPENQKRLEELFSYGLAILWTGLLLTWRIIPSGEPTQCLTASQLMLVTKYPGKSGSPSLWRRGQNSISWFTFFLLYKRSLKSVSNLENSKHFIM